MPWTWYDSHIIRIESCGPNTRRFWVEIQNAEAFHFKAGQFVTMDLPIHEKRLKRWRSYSIASAPDGGKVLEFCIVRLEGGAGTEYLFEEAKVGTPIRFKGPDGTFTLPDTIDTDLVFLCTGTGVAPFRSMLLDLKQRQLPTRNLHLIFGTREESGILYREEFEALAANWPEFRYDVALSRQPDWPGYKGYVHQIYTEHYAQPRPDVRFYLCGWTNMIDDAVATLLLQLGYEKSQILYELYG